MSDPALAAGLAAVVTGAGMGIGLAAATRCAAMGMPVCMADTDDAALEAAFDTVAAAAPAGADAVMAAQVDVSQADAMAHLADAVFARFGTVGLLMNNAVARAGGGVWDAIEDWQRAMQVNLWGVVNGVRAFGPRMMAQTVPSRIVNVGSKQGITNPPGNFAYNVTKAALKTYTEGLQHDLRNRENCQVTAHLLVPGWTTTGNREHKPGAWMPDQVIAVMLEALSKGDFYIVCPDDEVTPEMDRQRILWGAGDITENRLPLSRWHADYKEAFADFCKNV